MSTARERLYADFEDQDQQDYDPLTELGRIEVAIMGEGRMTLYGEGEAIELAMERPPLEDLGPAKELKGERAINHGSAYAPLLGIGEAQTEGDPDPDAVQDTRTLKTEQIRSLMRPGNRDNSKVNYQGDSVPSGGGGGGTGRAKDPKPFRGGMTPANDGSAPRHQVVGLTPGEQDFYERRPGEALIVIRALVQRIVFEDMRPERVPLARARFRYNFSVYGLVEGELETLQDFPGIARLTLAQHARDMDPARVAAVDYGTTRAEAA